MDASNEMGFRAANVDSSALTSDSNTGQVLCTVHTRKGECVFKRSPNRNHGVEVLEDVTVTCSDCTR